jgi:hypothetical protein
VTSADSHDWRLEGDYFEGCNCDSICPYIFMRDPDDGHSNAIVAWHIETGHYESTQLDGLNAVVVFVAPGNMFTGVVNLASIFPLIGVVLKSFFSTVSQLKKSESIFSIILF